MKVLGVTIAALVVTGAAVAAPAVWTARDAQAAARALAYPSPHARKVTCHATGVAFKCAAVYGRHHQKTFVLAPGTEGGWTCAGHTLHTCHVLRKGFLSATQVTGMGGLQAAAGYSATGYLQEHASVTPESAGPCSPAGPSSFRCPYSTPQTTVTVTYKRVKDGWVVSA